MGTWAAPWRVAERTTEWAHASCDNSKRCRLEDLMGMLCFPPPTAKHSLMLLAKDEANAILAL